MGQLKFLNVTETSECNYAGNFSFIKDNGKIESLPRQFTVRIIPICKTERPFFPSFFINEVCVLDVDEASVETSTKPYDDEDTTPDTTYRFSVEATNFKKIEDDRVRISLKWTADRYTMITGNAGKPYEFQGEAKIPFGNAKIKLRPQPDFTGSFTIEVFCNETDDGCMTSCVLI